MIVLLNLSCAFATVWSALSGLARFAHIYKQLAVSGLSDGYWENLTKAQIESLMVFSLACDHLHWWHLVLVCCVNSTSNI